MLLIATIRVDVEDGHRKERENMTRILRTKTVIKSAEVHSSNQTAGFHAAGVLLIATTRVDVKDGHRKKRENMTRFWGPRQTKVRANGIPIHAQLNLMLL